VIRIGRGKTVAGGYMGKILFVDLNRGEVKDEELDEKLCREFIGGYGIGARVIYSRQRGGVDPLGPENVLGFMTGPLTGTGAPFGTRYSVVAGKSPLTRTWGDSNSGGHFGAYLKFAGYDGVFFIGVSEKPVCLFIKDGKAELTSASHLWGKDTYETEDILKAELGKEVAVASIGPSGEKLSLISCIITDKGRAAGRSGLGAVMGSKKLKAVAVAGTARVPVADTEAANSLRREYLAELTGPGVDSLRRFGWSANTAPAAHNGGSPVKNWGGVGIRDFPHPELISGANVISHDKKRYACYRCPIACAAIMKAGKEYKYEAGVHRPEYETLAAFGTLCLNDNLESIIMANDICNRYGLDTISTGATIAFAIECYENGIITKEDTGVELTWGNHRAIIAITKQLAKREGFGALLADGSQVAAKKIGKGADKYAIHIHGQEPAMWDPKFAPAVGCSYQSDPTPGRHTQDGLFHTEIGAKPPGLELPPLALDKYIYAGKGKTEAMLRNRTHFFNASGACMNFSGLLPHDAVANFLVTITGWQLSPEEVDKIGQRIAALRQAFNVREGLTPKDFKLPKRLVGDPVLKEGPVANITVDVDMLVNEYYKAMDWDQKTGKPSKKKLLELGLEDVAKDIWPE